MFDVFVHQCVCVQAIKLQKSFATATIVGVRLCEEGQSGCGMRLEIGFSLVVVVVVWGVA